MQSKFLIKEAANQRLVVFFTGWNTDWHVVEEVTLPSGYDLQCCWDYRTLEWRKPDKDYEEVLILAWSFGVAAANSLIPQIEREENITGLYAVNGTVWPVDDERGIPEEIFEATLKGLNPRMLEKFRIRIAGGIRRYRELEKSFTASMGIDELKDELNAIRNLTGIENKLSCWDYAFISEGDRIFPPENMAEAWTGTPHCFINAEHLPDFQRIFNRVVKDKQSIRQNFERSVSTYNRWATSQTAAADRLVGLLQEFIKSPEAVLEVGSGSGYLTGLIKEKLKPARLTAIDISLHSPLEDVEFISGDAESVVRQLASDSFSCVVTSSALQWFHSPGRFLREVKRILAPGGVCALTVYIEGTLKELGALTGRSLIYLKEEDWPEVVRKAGFEIVSSELSQQVLLFDSVRDIFAHLKATGVNALGGERKSYGEMKRIMGDYPMKGDKYPLTYKSYITLLRPLK